LIHLIFFIYTFFKHNKAKIVQMRPLLLLPLLLIFCNQAVIILFRTTTSYYCVLQSNLNWSIIKTFQQKSQHLNRSNLNHNYTHKQKTNNKLVTIIIIIMFREGSAFPSLAAVRQAGLEAPMLPSPSPLGRLGQW